MPGAAVELQQCSEDPQSLYQSWAVDKELKEVRLQSTPPVCLTYINDSAYPLTVGQCGSGESSSWIHDANASTVTHVPTNQCVDVRQADSVVGNYACGSMGHLKQPNQQFAFDETTGNIVSLDITDSHAAGMCLTVNAPVQ